MLFTNCVFQKSFCHTIFKIMENICNNLNHSNKLTRRSALKHIIQEINKIKEHEGQESKHSHQEISSLYEVVEIPLISALSDESEVNRSMACETITNILDLGLKPKFMLKYIIPTLHHRIGRMAMPLIEECEENRLESLTIIENIIKIYGKDIELYVSDICDIICTSLKDKFPEAVLKSCDCIFALAAVSNKFPMVSNSFVLPLLKCIRIHRFKIRLKSIDTLACIFTNGSIHDFEEISDTFSKCLYDVPQVRRGLLSWGFAVSVKMKDRYSYWPMILPFVLFGIRDSDEEIRGLAEQYWDKIGLQYEIENDLKPLPVQKFQDCPIVTAIYGEKFPTFGIGCFTLIERNFHRMFEDINHKITDWQEAVRLQAVKLLTVCILGLQDNSIQYSNKIINILCLTFNDHEISIVKECAICSEVLGHFIPPDVYIPLIKPFLWGETDGHTSVLSCLVKNTPNHQIQKFYSLFTKIMEFDNVKDSISSRNQNNFIEIMECIFTSCTIDKIDEEICFTLFYIIAKNSWNNEETEHGEKILRLYIEKSKYNSEEEFFSDLMPTFLTKMKNSPSWTEETNPELHVFLYLTNCEGLAERSEEISDVWKSKVGHDVAPLVAFRAIQGMENVLKRLFLSKNQEKIQNWCLFILKEHILKMLQHNQGKTGEGLRMASISSLLFIIEHSERENYATFQALGNCLSYLPNLIVEDFVETRILSCEFIKRHFLHYKKLIKSVCFFSHMQLLSGRLNDEDKKVRRSAANSLTTCFKAFSSLKENQDKVKNAIDSVVVFTHEDDDQIKKNIIDLLQWLGKFCPSHLQSKLKEMNLEDLFLTKQAQHIKIDDS